MVALVPAEIPKFRLPRPAAPLRRRSLPLLTTHHPLSFCRPLVFILLRIPLPANPLFSYPSKIPRGCGGAPLPTFRHSDLQPCQLFCLQKVAASFTSLCPLFRGLVLCFQSLAASFCKIPGVGYPECNYGTRSGGTSPSPQPSSRSRA